MWSVHEAQNIMANCTPPATQYCWPIFGFSDTIALRFFWLLNCIFFCVVFTFFLVKFHSPFSRQINENIKTTAKLSPFFFSHSMTNISFWLWNETNDFLHEWLLVILFTISKIFLSVYIQTNWINSILTNQFLNFSIN